MKPLIVLTAIPNEQRDDNVECLVVYLFLFTYVFSIIFHNSYLVDSSASHADNMLMDFKQFMYLNL